MFAGGGLADPSASDEKSDSASYFVGQALELALDLLENYRATVWRDAHSEIPSVQRRRPIS